jgi:hypothetical protein
LAALAGAVVGFGGFGDAICIESEVGAAEPIGPAVHARDAAGDVADGDGEDADEVAGAMGWKASGELKSEDGIEGGLDGLAAGEVDVFDIEAGLFAGADGVAGAAEEVGALGDGVVGVVVYAESGRPSGGETAGEATAVDGVAGDEGVAAGRLLGFWILDCGFWIGGRGRGRVR